MADDLLEYFKQYLILVFKIQDKTDTQNICYLLHGVMIANCRRPYMTNIVYMLALLRYLSLSSVSPPQPAAAGGGGGEEEGVCSLSLSAFSPPFGKVRA